MMGRTKISEDDINDEKAILYELFKCSKEFKSVIFNSGAGSGKTYSLVETLKYIVFHNRDNLKNHNQKIACITYTNVAAEHIKKQLGVSDVVEISTIHDRIWDVIRNQKTALLTIHTRKLLSELSVIRDELQNNDRFKNYQKLDSDSQARLFDLMQEHRIKYNKAYNLGAAEFRKSLPEKIQTLYSDLIGNISNFKKLIDTLFKKKRYSDCLEKIQSGHGNFKAVYYDAMFNRDRLDKMRISHDTLLEYGYKIVEEYPKMRRLIADRYPYILIDEYQDTSEYVVKIMNLIDHHAKEIKHDIFIAYFGDSVQSIYDTGVGNKVTELHSDLHTIFKMYNRRSYSEIIEVANRVRNDEIKQVSIYSDSTGGSSQFYYGGIQDVDRFIEMSAKKWNAKIEEPLHCLFATNQMVAKYSGFTSVYEVFQKAKAYKGIAHKQLNTELLSHDTVHLGEVQSILYRIMKLYTKSREMRFPLRNILSSEVYKNMSFTELKLLMRLLQSIEGDTLGGLLDKIFNHYDTSDMNSYKYMIEKLFDIDEDISYDAFLRYVSSSLYEAEDDTDETSKMVESLLDVKIEELLNWFHYVNRDEKKKICYHTFHSTKGLEYNNVIIVLEKDFGVSKGLFEKYFIGYDNDTTLKYEEGRNILYVVATRAIKNMRILYIDDVKQIKEKIDGIFGEACAFTEGITYENL